jgi:hypothetical protein
LMEKYFDLDKVSIQDHPTCNKLGWKPEETCNMNTANVLPRVVIDVTAAIQKVSQCRCAHISCRVCCNAASFYVVGRRRQTGNGCVSRCSCTEMGTSQDRRQRHWERRRAEMVGVNAIAVRVRKKKIGLHVQGGERVWITWVVGNGWGCFGG